MKDKILKVDYYIWETIPEKLKVKALEQTLVPEENVVIAVKTIMSVKEMMEKVIL